MDLYPNHHPHPQDSVRRHQAVADDVLLRMRGVRKSFGATPALRGVDLHVCAGEVLGLVGENGAGKSTLMKILAGAVRPDAGDIHLPDDTPGGQGVRAARHAGVAMIFQELALVPHLTVAENLFLGVEPRRRFWIDGQAMRRQAVEALAVFAHPELAPERLVSTLSLAARQLVEIGRALAVGCRVLVLDEPTSCLTQADAERLFAVMARLKQAGKGIIFISHVIEDVKRVADRITVLRDGQVVATRAAADLPAGELVALMVGRPVDVMYPRRGPRVPGDVVLEVQALAGRHRPRAASLTLRRGEVLGVAGLLGAGRTELLRCIMGLDPVRHGTVRVARLCGGLGLLSEDRQREGLALDLSLADNITLPRLPGWSRWGLVSPAQQDAAAQRWIERLQVRARGPRQRVGELSGGNQQKVALARLLHQEVDVWLLDEPTRGVDVGSKAELYEWIERLAAGDPAAGRAPGAVLVVSSYLPELMGLCDRIAVMARGQLGAARDVGAWTERGVLLAAMGQEVSDV